VAEGLKCRLEWDLSERWRSNIKLILVVPFG
jgi:hypothetical protein